MEQTIHGVTVQETSFREGASPRFLFQSTDSNWMYIDSDTVCKHILLLGCAGSGKTNIINQMVAQIHSRIFHMKTVFA